MLKRLLKKSIVKLSNYNSSRIYLAAQSRAVKEYFENFRKVELPPLSASERSLIENKWGQIIRNPQIGFHAFRVFKKYDCFDVNYVPEPYFYPYIIRVLNPTADYVSLAHKGLADSIFTGLNHPETIINRINGNYLDKDHQLITPSEAIQRVIGCADNMIIKPSKDTNSGRGVDLLRREASASDKQTIIDNYSGDFIVQKAIRQSSFTSQFNSTSVNTFRIITLLINNKLSVCYAILKMGSKGRIVDNGANGALWVGIRPDGILNDIGSNFSGEIYNKHNSIPLIGKKVPNFDKIKELAFEAHKRIASCGLVAWDIALDEHNNPLLIEANLWWPGISYGEICCGPIFGERTDEVIDYVKRHPLAKHHITPSV